MATSSCSIGQKCSRSPRLKTGRSPSRGRRTPRGPRRTHGQPSLPRDFPVWPEGARLMKRDGLPVVGGGLDGKVVVVTGGTGYLGSSVCKAFAETGATVVAVYLLDREIPYFEKLLGALGKNVTLLKADVTQAGEMDRVAKEILTRLKRIDVLVNTIGGDMAGAPRNKPPGGLQPADSFDPPSPVPPLHGGLPS